MLRIEYYPTSCFPTMTPTTSAAARPRRPKAGAATRRTADEVQRLMNKASQVTLWVEPKQHQMVKFTFDNAGLDFLPMAWLVRVGELKASMAMGEAFPGCGCRAGSLRLDRARPRPSRYPLRLGLQQLSRSDRHDENPRRGSLTCGVHSLGPALAAAISMLAAPPPRSSRSSQSFWFRETR